ncbi:MAG TPA: ATP-binding cassette domain-containing protein [Candidatus Binatia bacterium]|nr:ATP-binding cassette domain-containing protein [Candidatus Binatia bacterium]
MNDAILNANFRKRFAGGPEMVVENLRVNEGVTVLFGASGAGKTTILRCLAGLERPEAGKIQFAGEQWFDAATQLFLPPRQRAIGFVPQDYALFPHLTVAGNVGYGLKALAAGERAKRVTETLRWLGLDGLEHRLPRELSGGQQQRVALARAVVRRPKLLLLDEPLAALDTPTRLRLRSELRQYLRQLRIPTVLVTHDRLEALALGDDVVMIHDGRNVQHGAAHEVFSRPVNLAVAEMIAVETIQPGRVIEIRDGLASVAVGDARLTAFAGNLPADAIEVYVCIRSEDVILMRADTVASSPRNRLAATVLSLNQEGPLMRVNLNCGFPLTALLTRPACEELQLKSGDHLFALVKAPQVHLIPFTR